MDMLRNVSQVISVRVQTLSEALLLMDFIWKLMQISICYDILWYKTARNLSCRNSVVGLRIIYIKSRFTTIRNFVQLTNTPSEKI
jgi:hypothetical protein